MSSRESFDLRELIEEVAEELSAAKGYPLLVEVGADVPDEVVGNALLLRRILLEIGRKATPATAMPGLATVSVVASARGLLDFRLTLLDPVSAKPDFGFLDDAVRAMGGRAGMSARCAGGLSIRFELPLAQMDGDAVGQALPLVDPSRFESLWLALAPGDRDRTMEPFRSGDGHRMFAPDIAPDDCRETAHRLSGQAALLGLVALNGYLREVETAAARNEAARLTALLENLPDLWKRSSAALAAAVEGINRSCR